MTPEKKKELTDALDEVIKSTGATINAHDEYDKAQARYSKINTMLREYFNKPENKALQNERFYVDGYMVQYGGDRFRIEKTEVILLDDQLVGGLGNMGNLENEAVITRENFLELIISENEMNDALTEFNNTRRASENLDIVVKKLLPHSEVYRYKGYFFKKIVSGYYGETQLIMSVDKTIVL